MSALRVGTRGSLLALTQTDQVIALLRAAAPERAIERVIIQTEGDRRRRASLLAIGGQGVFTRELEVALLDGEIDVAVHSLKDLPSTLPDGLLLAATPAREEPRDLLVTRDGATLDTLPEGATVGTGSLRRRAQLLAARPDLVMRDIRGNVDTRLRKLAQGDYDAILLAAAGVKRLGSGYWVLDSDDPSRIPNIQYPLPNTHYHLLPLATMLPAPAQGILGLECRAGDDGTRALLARVSDAASFAAAQAERAVLRRFGIGCRLPLAAFAEARGDTLTLRARVLDLGGTVSFDVDGAGHPRRGHSAGHAGRRGLGGARRGGAAGRFGACVGAAGGAVSEAERPLAGLRVIVTRARAQASELSEQLRALGAEPIELPAIRIAPPEDEYRALDAALAQVARYDWIVFTSVNGVEHVCERLAATGRDAGALAGARVAAIGSATAGALVERGVSPDLVPERYVAESLLDALTESAVAGKRFLLPRADIARAALREGLEAAGALVDEVHAYRTVQGQPEPEALRALDEGADYVTFTSSSTVRNFVAQIDAATLKQLLEQARVAAIGPITARTARAAGLRVDIVAAEYTIPGLVAAIREHARAHPYRFGPLTEVEAREIALLALRGAIRALQPLGGRGGRDTLLPRSRKPDLCHARRDRHPARLLLLREGRPGARLRLR